MDNSADNIFRIISFVAFTVTIAGVALHSVFCRHKRIKPGKEISQFQLISLRTLKILTCIVIFICTLVLIITGFFPKLILAKTISGYWLMLHVTAATVFVCCLALFGLLYAEQHIFTKSAILRAITFWLILLLGLPLILSIVLSMFPFFGTHIQEFLIWTHRYSALLFSITAIMHTYLTFLGK